MLLLLLVLLFVLDTSAAVSEHWVLRWRVIPGIAIGCSVLELDLIITVFVKVIFLLSKIRSSSSSSVISFALIQLEKLCLYALENFLRISPCCSSFSIILFVANADEIIGCSGSGLDLVPHCGHILLVMVITLDLSLFKSDILSIKRSIVNSFLWLL